MDSPSAAILVIDIGNTNTVLGLYEGATLRALWRLTTNRDQTADEYGVVIHNLFALENLSASDITGIMIASVVPPMDSVLAETARKYFKREATFLGPGARTGMALLVDTPQELGADRVADAVAAFEKYSVLTKRELESREEIAFEQYVKTVNVEANLVLEIGKTVIYPAAVRYQGQLADTAAKLKAVGIEDCMCTLKKVTELTKELLGALGKLEEVHGHASSGGVQAHAKHFLHEVIPAISAVRLAADALEGIIADDLWPLPTYQEMLFIK